MCIQLRHGHHAIDDFAPDHQLQHPPFFLPFSFTISIATTVATTITITVTATMLIITDNSNISHVKHLPIIAPCPLRREIERLPRPVFVLREAVVGSGIGVVSRSGGEAGEIRLEEVGEERVVAVPTITAVDCGEVAAFAVCEGWLGPATE